MDILVSGLRDLKYGAECMVIPVYCKKVGNFLLVKTHPDIIEELRTRTNNRLVLPQVEVFTVDDPMARHGINDKILKIQREGM